MAKKVAMESTLSLVLLAMMAALCQAQLPPLPPLPTGLTLPPNFTLPTLPPEEDLPLIVLNVPGYATVKGGPSLSWFTGRPYTYFRGLPYAKAPTNETRFLPPVPIGQLDESEILDTWGLNPGCVQRVFGTEDCLTVNIFTPKLPPNATESNPPSEELLPVMFWIHGGGFATGQTSFYTGFKYMEHDVVVVEVQYRLHALGFLYLDIDEVPGNAGIFDQIEALRWVQKNIKYFGGDPSRVTVFGESAGGSSVALLMLAPQAKGLFHRVIGQSGAMLSDWALDRNATATGYRIAELAGCPLAPKDELVSCLRNIDAAVLTTAQREYERENRKYGGNGFGGASPVIQYAGKERLLTEEPGVLMESGNYTTDIDIMFGANQQEGIYVLGVILNDYLRPNNLMNDTQFFKSEFMATLLKCVGIRDDTGALADALLDKYFEGIPLGDFEEMMPGSIDVIGTLFLKAGGWNTVIKHAKHSPGRAYWYSYEFRSRYSILGSSAPIPQGINHADELLGLIVYPVPFNETERTMSKRMLKVWTNFATYGKPTPDDWNETEEEIPNFPPYDRENQSYMRIDVNWTVERDYTNSFTVMGDEYRKNLMATTVPPSPTTDATPATEPVDTTTATPATEPVDTTTATPATEPVDTTTATPPAPTDDSTTTVPSTFLLLVSIAVARLLF